MPQAAGGVSLQRGPDRARDDGYFHSSSARRLQESQRASYQLKTDYSLEASMNSTPSCLICSFLHFPRIPLVSSFSLLRGALRVTESDFARHRTPTCKIPQFHQEPKQEEICPLAFSVLSNYLFHVKKKKKICFSFSLVLRQQTEAPLFFF